MVMGCCANCLRYYTPRLPWILSTLSTERPGYAKRENESSGAASERRSCVQTTAREANDRGYECLILEDCVGSYFPEFQRVALEMIKAQGGIVGWVANSAKLLRSLGRS